MGVVTSINTTPTQYGTFFQTYVPLRHNMDSFQAESTFGQYPPLIMPTWPDLGSDNAHFVRFWSEFGSESANLVQLSIRFGPDSALFA